MTNRDRLGSKPAASASARSSNGHQRAARSSRRSNSTGRRASASHTYQRLTSTCPGSSPPVTRWVTNSGWLDKPPSSGAFEAHLLAALAVHGRRRVLGGLHMAASGQPQSGQAVVHEEAAAAGDVHQHEVRNQVLGWRRRLGGPPDRRVAADPGEGIGAVVGLRCIQGLDRAQRGVDALPCLSVVDPGEASGVASLPDAPAAIHELRRGQSGSQMAACHGGVSP